MLALLVSLGLRSTCPTWEGHARDVGNASLLESSLQQLGVNLTAQLVKQRFHLADFHVLKILSVSQQLRLIIEHVGSHASDYSLRICLEVLLVILEAALPIMALASSILITIIV